MKAVALALAVLSALAPGLAAAQACDHEERIQMTCAQGQTWDPETRSCVVVGA